MVAVGGLYQGCHDCPDNGTKAIGNPGDTFDSADGFTYTLGKDGVWWSGAAFGLYGTTITTSLSNQVYWKEINASAEILDKLVTLNTGKTSEERAKAEQVSLLSVTEIYPIEVQMVGSYPAFMDLLSGGAFIKTSSYTLKAIQTTQAVNTGRKYYNATQAATKMGGELVKKYKSIVDTGARSGEHGRAFIKAGQELIRKANNKNNGYLPEFAEAMKKVGNRLISKGKGINHKN